MNAQAFISKRLGFKGKMAVVSIAISLFIIILAMAISDGFRREIREGLSSVSGDITLTKAYGNFSGKDNPINSKPSFLADLEKVRGVEKIEPVIYRTGILKSANGIHGVIFKGSAADTVSMGIRIPSSIAGDAGVKAGDDITAYFISEKSRIRKFKVTEVYSGVLDTGESPVVYMPISDLRRVNGWAEDQCSVLEISLADGWSEGERLSFKKEEIGSICLMSATDDDDILAAVTSAETFGRLFDWLDLIDFNVYAIMVLMMAVAGFNMISGLLILLFRNISTIGILKSLGMGDRQISGVFLRIAARAVIIGGLIGNAAAIFFCLIQKYTGLISLNPENYFVSSVPICLNTAKILLVNAISFAVIMIMMLIPTVFISKVDPSLTVKTE